MGCQAEGKLPHISNPNASEQMLNKHCQMMPHGKSRAADLADIVEIPVGRCLLGQELLVGVEHDVQVELLLQQHQAVVAEALDGAHGRNLAHPAPHAL